MVSGMASFVCIVSLDNFGYQRVPNNVGIGKFDNFTIFQFANY